MFVNKDLPLATFLSEKLSGTVNKAQGNYYVLSIYKQSALHSLCKMINGKFRTPTRLKYFIFIKLIRIYSGLFHKTVVSQLLYNLILLDYFIDYSNLSYSVSGELIFLYCSIVPLVIYSNSNLNKSDIIKENKGKSGIYRWTNLLSVKSYIGSSINLGRRLRLYYNFSHLNGKNKNSLIHKALLKYGYYNFKLEILEYCDTVNCIEREQFYRAALDLLKPEYNILLKAGSTLGYKHSEEAKAKMKVRARSPEKLARLKAFHATVEQKARVIALSKMQSHKVEILDLLN